MPDPTVSVVIPVYNVRPWLGECLDSVRRQTIGTARLEVIAVDDGSTDGSWEELSRLAAEFPELTAERLPANSGGPGGPRNRGLELASGTYVFFLDGDDYLGDEALERLVAMAERASADVVLGRMATPPGHRDRAPKSMFGRSMEKADLYTSKVFNSLGPWKLFRRSLIEDNGIRFPEGVPRREDGPFTSLCYLKAATISIVADYDCYYLRQRADGSNATNQPPDYPALLDIAADLFGIVTDNVPRGEKRDRLLQRHVRTAVLTLFGGYWLATLSDTEKRGTFGKAHALLEEHLTDGILAALDPRRRLLSHLIAVGDFDGFIAALGEIVADTEASPVVEDGRAYLPLTFFRDATRTVPDQIYDVTDRLRVDHELGGLARTDEGLRVTGTAVIPDLPNHPQTVELVLRERAGESTVTIPATTTESGAFEGVLDPSKHAMPDGLWDVSVAVAVDGLRREQRLGTRRADGLAAATESHELPGRDGSVVATVFHTKYGNLGLDLGEHVHSTMPVPLLKSMRSTTTRLRLTVDYPAPPDDRLVDAVITLARGPVRHRLSTTTTTAAGNLRLTAGLALPGVRLRPGSWDVRVDLQIGDLHRDVLVVNKKGRSVRVRLLPRLTALARRLRRR
ncbi:glycosyltransferase family 2 protein [Phytomonospora endophytica]|uniref:CDP-glycerol glycerophosphotransferase n=1 Tax=Phytomonospora endophytica TaxID=714109 RepID=A0A841FX00_9ACTN|nr:glycosyltransferase family 2 protein [Phytomonospora endophytica]MBB6038062.1 CDP-glycerol glycerophosphotransferase [Phytomonospora endophytica]GIG67474.1 glycosyl transferase [Phytomonospora endophytica]